MTPIPPFGKNTRAALAVANAGHAVRFPEGGPIDAIAILRQSLKVGTWDFHPKDGLVYWSKEVFEIHGRTPGRDAVAVEDAIGAFHAQDAKELGELVKRAVSLRMGYTCRFRLRRQDGALRLTESCAAPVLNKHGETVRLVGTFRDVTRETENENNRRSGYDAALAMLKLSPTPTLICDTRLRPLAANTAWLGLHGIADRTAAPPGLDASILTDGQRALVAVAIEGQGVGKEIDRIALATGQTYEASWRAEPWRDGVGDVAGLVVTIERRTNRPLVDGATVGTLAIEVH